MEKFKKFDVHWVVKNYSTFDEFMDWVDTDIGISEEKMQDTYKVVSKEFEDAGYPEHALLIRLKIK